MNYTELLHESAKERNSIVCLGMDPVMEDIPIQGKSVEETITKFYSDILNMCESENVWPSACKPNYAFYAQYGFEGLRALKKVCEIVKEKKLPLILDGKRGDIGKTSGAYAKEVYSFWGADCATISPYMGWDTIEPFAEWCTEKGKGIYVLARTSNPSAAEFQNLEINGVPLYEKVSEKIADWNQKTKGGVGAVIGATSIAELQRLHDYFSSRDAKVPYLIPGLGKQGGSASEVMNVLQTKGADLTIHRINSSSDINYAYKKQNTTDYAGAAVKALRELNNVTKI